MVNIKKSSYILLLSEDDEGNFSLVKLRRNFTYHFDSIIFGQKVDICHLYNIVHLLTEDELLLLLYLNEAVIAAKVSAAATLAHTKTYLEAMEPSMSMEELVKLASKFTYLYAYCGKDITAFGKKIETLKQEFKTIVEISSHPAALGLLVDEIHRLLTEELCVSNTKPLVYPGGRKRADEKNMLDAAIRETEEEISVRKNDFRVLRTKPLFRETYTSSDGIRYAQMFFMAKLNSSTLPSRRTLRLESIFNDIVCVPIEDLDENDLLENTIKSIDLKMIKHDSVRDARAFIISILSCKSFTETEIYKNYNTGKMVKDYKTALVKYLAKDLVEKPQIVH